MKAIKLKRILGSFGIVLCLSAVLVACSSELDEMNNVTKQSSRAVFDSYIDIDSELIETGMLYVNDQELNRYMEALLRFDSYVKIENGLLKYTGGTSDDLNISEFLFELFTSKILNTNKDIQDGRLVVVDGELYSSANFKNGGHIMRIKSRSEPAWTPGRLDGSSQEIGQTILDAMRQIFYIYITGGDLGKLGDYVDLYSYSWSQGNSTLSGLFTFNGTACNYSIANPNAGMGNNATGFNYLSSIDNDKTSQIYVKENKYQSRVMTITAHDNDTFLELKRYIGYGV